jgi:hypothetical protein
MKILFIIGNGFDLRLNLPTSYPEFLKYYKEQEPKHNIGAKTSKEKFFALMHEKQNIGNDRWKDLEVALGDFTSSFADKAQFLDFYRDINQCLVDYLSNVEEKANPSLTNEESEYLKQSLVSPYNYLTNREKELFKSRMRGEHLYASIISFNYTSTLEALCENTIKIEQSYNRPDSSYHFMLNDIKHIHGILTTKSILPGVDNEGQISNEEFRLDEDILDVMVKPRGNENIGSLIDRECLALIQEAMVIYVFGTSLGQTDKTWWAAIKERFLANPEVTILYFLYEENSRPILPTEKASFQRRARQQFMTALGLEGNEKDYRDRIFIGLNTDMFPKRE